MPISMHMSIRRWRSSLSAVPGECGRKIGWDVTRPYRTLPVYENKNGRDLARPFPVISGQGLYREQGRG